MKLAWATRKGIKELLRFLILVPIISGMVIGGSRAGLFRSPEWSFSDHLFTLHPPEDNQAILDRFLIVTIDESDLKFIRRWPITDEVMLRVFRNILAQNPRLVGMDIYRDLPVEPGHEELQDFLAEVPNVVGIEKVVPPTVSPPSVLSEKGQVAASDLIVDRDGKIRRGLVILGKGNDEILEGLGAYMALRYLEAEGIELEVLDADRQRYQLGQAEFTPLTGAETLYTAEDTGGYQILLNYIGTEKDFPSISFQDVLTNRFPPGLMDDRIVLIGSIAPSLNDNHRTPYNTNLLTDTNLMPGVLIHANMAAQIIAAALNDRPLLKLSNRRVDLLLIVILTIYGTIAGMFYVKYRGVTWILLIIGLSLLFGGTFFLFLAGWIIPLFTPLLALLLAGGCSMGTSLWIHLNHSYKNLEEQHKLLEQTNEKLKLINENYSRFVPFEYLSFLGCESIIDLKLGDHVSRLMAIMFSDIRDFTALAEEMNPQEIFDFVNVYLQKVSPEIRNHGGIIVKFMGDSIMSIFPTEIDRCIEAAIAKQRRLEEFNEERLEQGLRPIRIGIGVHVGNVRLIRG